MGFPDVEDEVTTYVLPSQKSDGQLTQMQRWRRRAGRRRSIRRRFSVRRRRRFWGSWGERRAKIVQNQREAKAGEKRAEIKYMMKKVKQRNTVEKEREHKATAA